MKLGIMQPYFIPYIGYWQLLNAVDQYVIYDDVNFIKGGWINRNRILVNKVPQYFNIPMLGASPNKLIKEVRVNQDEKIINKNLRIAQAAYAKAPYFHEVYPMIEEMLRCGEENLASYIAVSTRLICDYLGVTTKLLLSSKIPKNNRLTGQDKVLEICKVLEASDYYNAIGGRELYSFEVFRDNGLNLHFLKRNEIRYKQFGEEFYPDLSIVDVMMFNSKTQIQKMLGEYTVVDDISSNQEGGILNK